MSHRYDYRDQFSYLGHDDLSARLCFIPEHEIINRSLDQLRDHLRWVAQTQHRLPVLGLDNNPHRSSYLQSILDLDVDVKYFILLPDFGIRREFDHAQPWPTWPIIQQILDDPVIDIDRIPRYRATFLSGNMRYHRFYLAQKIQARLQDQDLVIINRLAPENYSNTLIQDSENFDGFIAQLPWSNHPEMFDIDPSTNSIKNTISIVGNPAYDACLNITGESDPTNGRVCLSEKTWKSYWAGCLTVNYGSDIAPDWLRSQGFGIVDHIDPVCDFRLKSQIIADRLVDTDIRSLYHETRDLRLHNQNLVRSRDWVRSLADSAIEKIKSLL